MNWIINRDKFLSSDILLFIFQVSAKPMGCSFSFKMLIFILISVFFLKATNQTAPTPKPCTSNQVEVNVANDAHTEANLMCLVSSEEVMDCQYYDLRGFCIQCPEGTSQSRIINLQIQACVPYAQQVVNCEGYRRFSPLDYECVGCMASALLLVPLTGNPYGIPRACAQIYVPGCIEAMRVHQKRSINRHRL
jgi:hypothetical protein